MFRYEIHLHSSGCSACGSSTAEEMVDAAHEQGFAGVVFSNHFFRGNSAVDRALPWADFVGAYTEDYRRAKKYAEKYDMDVLFGVEEGLGHGKECLIYGLEPEVIANEAEFPRMTLPQIAAFVRNNGGWIVCAHPFRDRDYIENPDEEPNAACFDAIEVHNHFNTEEENRKAAAFAKTHGLPGTSGGDIHNAANLGVTGLAFYERMTDNKKLMEALKNLRYKMIVEGALKDPM